MKIRKRHVALRPKVSEELLAGIWVSAEALYEAIVLVTVQTIDKVPAATTATTSKATTLKATTPALA